LRRFHPTTLFATMKINAALLSLLLVVVAVTSCDAKSTLRRRGAGAAVREGGDTFEDAEPTSRSLLSCQQKCFTARRKYMNTCRMSRIKCFQQARKRLSSCRANCSSQASTASSAVNQCSLPFERGMCRAKITKWYHNSATGKCEIFYYGGCDGNSNRFDSKAACEAKCD